jgi:hypothetical protein
VTKKELAISAVVGVVIGILISFHTRQQIAPISYPPLQPVKPIVNIPLGPIISIFSPSTRPINPVVNSPPRRIQRIPDPAFEEFAPLTCFAPGQFDPISCSISENTTIFVAGGEKVNRRVSVITYTLFDHQISNDDKRASKVISLPEFDDIDSAKLEITAYNDDPIYTRSIWFEMDGTGGNIGTYHAGIHDVSGIGVIGPKRTKTWNYDLRSVRLATTGEAGDTKKVDLLEVLSKPGTHTISSSVTTYEKYGPQSWVSIKLVINVIQEKRNGQLVHSSQRISHVDPGNDQGPWGDKEE